MPEPSAFLDRTLVAFLLPLVRLGFWDFSLLQRGTGERSEWTGGQTYFELGRGHKIGHSGLD
jgi:hypothetical protein